MFMIKLFGFLLFLLPGLAGAELLQYRYTDTQGQEKTQTPSHVYGNPDGSNVEIALSGGLDRKVRVEVWKGGRLVTSAESGILNSTNRITVAGQDYCCVPDLTNDLHASRTGSSVIGPTFGWGGATSSLPSGRKCYS